MVDLFHFTDNWLTSIKNRTMVNVSINYCLVIGDETEEFKTGKARGQEFPI
jgi:hypothetical protein